jgi:hypothetical protein
MIGGAPHELVLYYHFKSSWSQFVIFRSATITKWISGMQDLITRSKMHVEGRYTPYEANMWHGEGIKHMLKIH